MKTTVYDFGDYITEMLQDYNAQVDEELADEIDKLTKEVVKELKNDTVIPEKTGDYKKGFYAKKIARGRGYARNVVANKKYQLTHLLEHGHATRSGGRTKAYPHWSTAQKKVDELAERMERRL